MIRAWKNFAALLVSFAIVSPARSQEAPAEPPATAPVTTEEAAPAPAADAAPSPRVRAGDKVDEVVDQVDQSQQAQAVKSNILRPIYSLAERLSFPTFHWLSFALMVAGVVSFALQLVIGKLVVLSRFSISPSEILSDALGLAVSLIGLVLTTQAATENSTFTSSAFAVISATGFGALVGFIFYLWGQRQELQAAAGRRIIVATDPKRPADRAPKP
jgi:hypothetical protein